MTDLQIARQFFGMLTKNGAKIKETEEENCISFMIEDSCWEGVTATEFSFRLDGDYWRIDGAVYGPMLGGHSKSKIHQVGWK